ncbi:hypothetical protein CN918_30130 [Priestia megaterium]|nr:hypothetical protein CN918_30130 [Priestia megaterium]
MTRDEIVQQLLGSLFYVGAKDFNDLAIATAVEIYEQPIFSNTMLGDGVAGKIHIKYPDNDEPEEHAIHIELGDNFEEDAFICTRRLDYTGREHEDEFETVFMSEMLS